MRLRIFILIMILVMSAVGCDVQTDTQKMIELAEEVEIEDAEEEQTVSVTTPTLKPKVTAQPTPKPTDVLEPTEKPTVIQTQAPESILTPTADLTPVETPKPTVKPTSKPKPEQTPAPTPLPTPESTPEPTPEPEVEITAVSSAFINSAMAEINRRRHANGVEPAVLVGSISSSCKNHAVKMAESGSPFHASNPGGCEAVGRVSDAMPGSTVGGTAVTHVGQLATAEVTKIGIGAVYCNGYLYFVVRGTP